MCIEAQQFVYSGISMSVTNTYQESITTTTSWWHRATLVGGVGLLGLLGLWLQPVPQEVLKALPHAQELSAWLLRTLLVINPLVLLLIASATGAALAHRVGLTSVFAGTAVKGNASRQLAFAALAGLTLGCTLGLLDQFLAPWLPDAWQQITRSHYANSAAWIVAMLYGGLSEEIILRWGLMSLLAWLMVRGLALPVKIAVPVAIALCALAFGAAHLPVITMQMEVPTALLGRTMLVNGLAGMVYGWLFWRYHLEAAMAAHAASHVGLFVVAFIVTG
jgi:Type II CAAX prenyl endopeptidase Rce1-like